MYTRIEAARSVLQAGEAALILSGPGRRYLTGYPSSEGAVLLTAKRACLYVDFRYIEKARATVQHVEVIQTERLSAQIGSVLQEEGITHLLVETEEMSLAQLFRYRKALEGISIDAEDDRLDRILEKLRAQKTPQELASIRAAQALTDETFTYILDRLTPGRTEREVMLDMEYHMRRAGSEGVAFDLIVVSGKNSSLPHGVPGARALARGDFVTMDFGAVIDGYCSDMTRTVAIGTADEEQRRVYATVLQAQEAAFSHLRAGVPGCEVDRAAREVIDGAGYAGCFGHALGHSVGLAIHESPTCSPRSETPLPAGTVMTVEPGIYLPDRFGVRIEDMAVVTDAGYENLTHSEKRLLLV